VAARTDWEEAANDVRRFLPERARQTLELWGHELFHFQVEQLGRQLA
jgi:hypothetical protein